MAEFSVYSRFANQLLQTLCEENEIDPAVSPYSVLTLLAVSADAAAGDTRAEILHALSGDSSWEDISGSLRELRAAFSHDSSFSSATAVCVRSDMADTIRPDYPAKLRAQYDGELFSAPGMARSVNAWCRDHTHGQIRELADGSAASMLLCLLNATAFEGRWTERYTRDDIVYRVFHNADGSSSEVAMISDAEHGYIENDSVTGFVKPYQGAGFSFMALLPKDDSPAGLRTALEKLDLAEAFAGRTGENVHIFLPEFRLTSETDLPGYCRSLGIRSLFSGRADLKPLSSAQLKLDSVIHKVRIVVDREGTRADAATVALACSAGGPRTSRRVVELIRPFIYAIMHNETGLPVFAGIVNQL